jgi:hypothetical protein
MQRGDLMLCAGCILILALLGVLAVETGHWSNAAESVAVLHDTD